MSPILALCLALLPVPAFLARSGRWPGLLVAGVCIAWLAAALAALVALPALMQSDILGPISASRFQMVAHAQFIGTLGALILGAGGLYLALGRMGALRQPGAMALCLYVTHALMLVPLAAVSVIANMTLPRSYAEYSALSQRADSVAEAAMVGALVAAGGFTVLAVAGLLATLRDRREDRRRS